MRKKNKILKILKYILMLILSGTVYAVSVNCFLSKNQILNGGFTGLATVINYLWGFPIGSVILILNIPLFLISLKKIGLKFVMSSFAATAAVSVMIDLLSFLPVYKGDLLLASLFGGVLSGLSLGIIFVNGATTGGTDIIAKLIKIKYPHVRTGKIIFLLDFIVIVLGGAVFGNIESALYAAVVIFVSAETLDFVIFGVHRTGLVIVITEKGDEMKKYIVNEIDRGVTVLKARGGYSDAEKNMLICALYDRATGEFIKKIKAFDEKAFVIITAAKEILGEGFKI